LVNYRRIGLDTNVLIYYIEEHSVFLKKVVPLIHKNGDVFITNDRGMDLNEEYAALLKE
jgi:hypothetical protein